MPLTGPRLFSRFQDLCPRFAHHLFAISAVSGGSLGASVYSALISQTTKDDKRFEAESGCVTTLGDTTQLSLTDVAEDMLSEDYLSPVLAFFLFPDLMQKFLFFPVASFDRSSALEKSLELAWDAHTAPYRRRVPEAWSRESNPFREPFSNLWNVTSDVPSLFLNTTEVETGRGRVIAPLTLEAPEFSAVPKERAGRQRRHRLEYSYRAERALPVAYPARMVWCLRCGNAPREHFPRRPKSASR